MTVQELYDQGRGSLDPARARPTNPSGRVLDHWRQLHGWLTMRLASHVASDPVRLAKQAPAVTLGELDAAEAHFIAANDELRAIAVEALESEAPGSAETIARQIADADDATRAKVAALLAGEQ